ncbi:aspartyl protease family protein [Mucilaginibacter sp. SMC90]|uniref:pepsin/retropepsin-like aspartic protease family protein n=1 Tax=Mucilaginibacter sp. SMC90 TaxID=2929803 RepID=UPI001FB25410|nr:pepsin/retropepsin-like aspartic protease family protein [Mucilaginibacter sp. SMC90]UOE47361.1 aspartyl protease family protein [Mucilaginibacter sp. SMC90]
MLLFAFCFNAEGGERVTISGLTFKNVKSYPDPSPTGDFKTLVIPIKRAGNLIVIEAQIDTLEGNFVLDTGAPYLVLNETYFRYMPHVAEQESAGVNGYANSSFTTYVRNLNILDLHYPKLRADVTDLSAIENGKGIKILGLLGTRLFADFAITVDLFRNSLYIQKLDENGNIPEAEKVFHDRFMVSPFRMLNDVILMKGTINDNSLWFAFDSAAETSLLDYRRSKKLIPEMEVVSRTKIMGIGGTSIEVIYTRFDNLVVGDRKYMKNRILITNLEKMGNAYGYKIDGVLGYDFFVRGIFTINFVKKEFEMYIYSNQ